MGLVLLALVIAQLTVSVCAQEVTGADLFAQRETVRGNGIGAGDLRLGTPEPGEPWLPGSPRGQTLWWRYVASGKGRVRLEGSPTNALPLVAVYRGTELAQLQLVASNTAVFCNCHGCETRLLPATAFDVTDGEELAVAVDWHDFVPAGGSAQAHHPGEPPAGGPIQLQFTYVPAPANDDLANSQVLTGGAVKARAELWAASLEPIEPEYASNPAGRSVWFTWTAPTNGQLQITPGAPRVYPTPAVTPGPVPWEDWAELWSAWGLLREDWSLPPGYGSIFTNGGGGIDPIDWCPYVRQNPPPPFYPLFGIYFGEGLPLVPFTGVSTNLDVYVLAGTTFRIAVTGNAGTGEDVDFQLRLTPRPANADFENRIVLPGSSADAIGHTVGTGLPSPGSGAFGNQPRVWWSWKSPGEGPIWLATLISDRRVQYEVYAGEDFATLQAVTTGETSVSFYAQRGVSYAISTTVADSPGEIRFSLRHLPARLQAALVSGVPGRQDLIIAEANAPRILVQLAEHGRWHDVAFAIPPTNMVSSASAYLLPLDGLSPTPTPGNARVWLLDFPLPAVRLLSPRVDDSVTNQISIAMQGVPGLGVNLEMSADLRVWTPFWSGTLVDFQATPVDTLSSGPGLRFYRVSERAFGVRPLLSPGPEVGG